MAEVNYRILVEDGIAVLSLAGVEVGRFRKGPRNQQLQCLVLGLRGWHSARGRVGRIPLQVREMLAAALGTPVVS